MDIEKALYVVESANKICDLAKEILSEEAYTEVSKIVHHDLGWTIGSVGNTGPIGTVQSKSL